MASHDCKIIDVEYLGGHRLHLSFNDGAEGDVDLSDVVQQGVFQSLRDPIQFTRFGLEHGTLIWNNQLDIAPEFLRERLV